MTAIAESFPTPLTMPTLRDYAERCRQLALSVRSDAVREHLLAMAREMEREATRLEHRRDTNTEREAC